MEDGGWRMEDRDGIQSPFSILDSPSSLRLPRSRLLDLDQVRHEHFIGVAERLEKHQVK
ncbi:MAG: hypothetical protein QOH01_3075 [Verrucomicrobiota bacterium]